MPKSCVTVDDLRSHPKARKLIDKLGLDGPNGQLSAFLSGLARTSSEKRPWELDSTAAVVRYLVEMDDAVREDRWVDRPLIVKGRRYYPARYVENPPTVVGQDPPEGIPACTLLRWQRKGCERLGGAKLRTYKNRLVLVRCGRSDGAATFRWAWFYEAKQIDEARETKKLLDAAEEAKRRQAVIDAANGIPPPPKPKPLSAYQLRNTEKPPDPAEWADSARAMGLTRAASAPQLHGWSKNGFPLPRTAKGKVKKLPLRKKNFRISGTRGVGTTFWWVKHCKDIGKVRATQRPDDATPLQDASDLPLVEDEVGGEKVYWRRERSVVALLGISENICKKWAERCPALDGAPFVRRLEPSVNSTKPDEWVYREDLFQKVLAARRRPNDEYDRADFYMSPDGRRFLPQHLAVQYVPHSVLHDQMHLPADQRVIEVREEFLPWRPSRSWRAKRQSVYSEADMLAHPKALRTEPLYQWLDNPPASSNGHHAAAGATPQAEPAAPSATPASPNGEAKGKNKGGRPGLSAKAVQEREAVLGGWERAKATMGMKEYCDQAGIRIGTLRRYMTWAAMRHQRQEGV